MARIAIVLASSVYADPSLNLPAAANDARAVIDLLRGTGTYDEVLELLDPATAQEAKRSLSEFAGKYRPHKIDEVFFYFSGHGDFRDDDFHYVLRTYDESRPRETGLENAELDDMLRGLNPALAVKVVDACNSGIPYIKSAATPTPLEKHINAT